MSKKKNITIPETYKFVCMLNGLQESGYTQLRYAEYSYTEYIGLIITYSLI